MLMEFNTFLHTIIPFLYFIVISTNVVVILLISTYFNKTYNDIRYINTLVLFYFVALPLPMFNTVFRLNQNTILEDIYSFSTELFVLSNTSLILNLFSFFIIICLIFFYSILTDRLIFNKNNDLEFSLIILIMFLNALLLIVVNTTIDVLIVLETLTFSAYILIAYNRKSFFSAYAGVQYLILSAIPSALFLLSLSFLYGNWGTVFLSNITTLNDYAF